MAVGIVRRHERRLLVLAVRLDQHRADRVGRGLAVEVLAEAVAHAVLAGRVVRAGDAGDVEHLLALRELVERDRDRARGRAGHQHDLVLVDEGLHLLHRLVRLGGTVGDEQVDLLAEQALGDLGRDLLEQRIAVVDVLDRELPALELVFALHRIGAGARHGGGDIDRVAFRAGRPGADRRLVADADREGGHGQRGRQHAPPARPAPACSKVRRDTLRNLWSFPDIVGSSLLVRLSRLLDSLLSGVLSAALIFRGRAGVRHAIPASEVTRSIPLWSMRRRSAFTQRRVHSFSRQHAIAAALRHMKSVFRTGAGLHSKAHRARVPLGRASEPAGVRKMAKRLSQPLPRSACSPKAAHESRYADETTDDGRKRLVRHGHLPEREIATGIGPVGVFSGNAGIRERAWPQASALPVLSPFIRRHQRWSDILA